MFEAVRRIMEPEDVDGKLMFIVACVGLGAQSQSQSILPAAIDLPTVFGLGGQL